MKLKKIAFGTYQLGDFYNAKNIIKKALEIGYRIFDTAESYDNGLMEKALGDALSEAKINRKEVFIMTKVSPNHLDYESVLKSAIKSVKRLNTFIDLYYIHIPNPNVPLEETFKAFEELKRKKIIRFFGVSNFNISQLKQANSITKIFAVQEEFNLLYQYTKPILNFTNANGILFFAYRPLYGGLLMNEKYLKLLKPFAEKYHKTPAQVAIRWILEHNAIPIIKTTKENHLKENFDVFWRMKKEDVIALTNVFSGIVPEE